MIWYALELPVKIAGLFIAIWIVSTAIQMIAEALQSARQGD